MNEENKKIKNEELDELYLSLLEEIPKDLRDFYPPIYLGDNMYLLSNGEIQEDDE